MLGIIRNNEVKYNLRESHLVYFTECLSNYHKFKKDDKNLFKSNLLFHLNYSELYILHEKVNQLDHSFSKDDLLTWWDSTSIRRVISEKFKSEIKIKFDDDFDRATTCLDNFNLIIFCISKLFEFQNLSNRNEFEPIILKLNLDIIRLRTELYSEVNTNPVLSATQSLSMFLFESKKNALNVYKKILIEVRNRKDDGYKTMYLMPLIERVKSKLKLDYLPYIELPSENEEKVLKFKKNIEFQELENITFPIGFPFREAKIISKKNILVKRAITSKNDFIETHFLFFDIENPKLCKKLEIDRTVVEDFYTMITEYYPSEVDCARLNLSRIKLREYFEQTLDGTKKFLIFTRFLIEDTDIFQIRETKNVEKLYCFYSEYFYDIVGFTESNIKSHISRTNYDERYQENFKLTNLYSSIKPFSRHAITKV